MACSRWSAASLNPVTTLIGREYQDTRSLRLTESLSRQRLNYASNLYRKNLYSHFGCVNAIEFSANGQWMVSGGDDRRAMLWNVEKAVQDSGQPIAMKGEHGSNIFCLGFDSGNRRIFSAGNDELVLIHDSQTGETLNTFMHDDAIYGLSVDPVDDNVFATACSDSKVYIFDARGANQDACITLRSEYPFHAVMHNPVEARLIATANIRDGVALWDTRSPKFPVLRFTDCLNNQQSAMSVRFNVRGTQILSLSRRHPPVLYNLTSQFPVAEFDHVSYYNSCTMKSCCFAGRDDEYVVSGSDDFKLYVWKLPDAVTSSELSKPQQCQWVDQAHMVLVDHRSIVNQVRYNYSNSLIASSGVEKIIKLWNCFPLPNGSGSLEAELSDKEDRKVYSHEDYINLVLESGAHMTHDYTHQSVQEDARMMAFFDSLVQRDIEGWTSESDSDSFDGRFNRSRYTNMKSSSSTSGDDDEIEESLKVLNPLSLSYVQTLNQRIECNRKLALWRNRAATPSSGLEPGTDPLPSTSSQSDASSHLRALRVYAGDTATEGNKISKSIHAKKRAHLRKVSRLAVRTTRRRLKMVRRFCAPVNQDEPQSSTAFEKATRFQSLVKLTDELDKSIEVESKTSCEDNSLRRNNFKLRRRLRYLTNPNEYILNQPFPRHSHRDSESTSASSDRPADSSPLWRTVRGNILRLSDSDDDDDDDDDADEIQTCDSSSDHDSDSSSSASEHEAEDTDRIKSAADAAPVASLSAGPSDKEVQVDPDCRMSHPVLQEQLEIEQESKSQSEGSRSRSEASDSRSQHSEPTVKLLNSSPSRDSVATTAVAAGFQTVVFKSVSKVNRSAFRKRKLADESPSSPDA